MKNIVSGILNKIDSGKPLDVISFATHESYQNSMAGVNASFYLYRGSQIKDWNPKFRKLPPNHFLLPFNNTNNPLATIPKELNPSVILCQTEAGGQFGISRYLSQAFHCPIHAHTHTIPCGYNQDYINSVKDAFKDVQGRSFISKTSREAWGYDGKHGNVACVVRHGISDVTFSPKRHVERRNIILSVVNEFKQRGDILGFPLWQRLVSNLPHQLVGDNGELGQPARDVRDLANYYASASIFLNTSLYSPIPSSLLEAASSECLVISTDNSAIPEFFSNGKNALLSNEEGQLRYWLEDALANPEKYCEVAKAGRKLVQERFSLKGFTDRWDILLRATANKFYKGEYSAHS